MPPYLSSSGSPDASHSAARAQSKASIGYRRCATTKEAKSGESGQPCYPFFHEELAPCSVGPFVMYSVCVAVEECGECW
jgi:hypothetical protein